jgi:hypothetical protein
MLRRDFWGSGLFPNQRLMEHHLSEIVEKMLQGKHNATGEGVCHTAFPQNTLKLYLSTQPLERLTKFRSEL